MVRPDYAGGGFVNLIASIAAACGGTPRHPPLRDLPPGALAGARNLVLLIVDGLGDAYLRREGRGGALLGHRRGALTSVFPSTTASAITTSLTGWSRRGRLCRRRASLPAARREVDAWRDAGAPVPRPCPGRRAGTAQHRGDAPSDRRGHVQPSPLRPGRAPRVAAATSGSEAKFIYVYWPEFDGHSHRHGNASPEVRAHFSEVDEAFAALLSRLAGSESIVVATADHGFVDSEGADALDLADAPGLAALLRYPLCGEPRAVFCHVQEGRSGEFVARARDWLGERARVCPSAELVAEGWFGPGDAHPRLAERVGDVTLLMHGRTTVKDWTPGEPRHRLIGHHGGASEDEMIIPLIVGSA